MASWRSWALLVVATSVIAGCRSLEGGGEPYEPHPVLGGFLLRTGSIQLGPRTGQNAVGWQGDGRNWLEFSGGQSDDSSD